ncbi:MAG: hypothetical protein JKY92_06075 [Magnetovibrio sp.]|nr:hypothetical protein [Magnetovibrio sp.]
MIQEILLLCDPLMVHDLEAVLVGTNPQLVVTRILSGKQLEERCLQSLQKTRILSFGSDIIVPDSVLKRLDCGAYNFHPGPPTYPGRFPSSFFLFDKGTQFGSTVHEMIAKVDRGAIIAVDWFEVPPNMDCVTLNIMSFQSLFAMFSALAPSLASRQEPFDHSDEVWQGRTTTQKNFDDLCRMPSDVNPEEFQRRYRAVGEGPDHALEITLHGHRFRLDNQHIAPDVIIGGKNR